MSERLAKALEACLRAEIPAVLVTIAQARGSTPREGGTRMLVAADRLHGTIGGGQLEYRAVAEARRMLEAGIPLGSLDVPLGPAIGQCCGGHVRLELHRAEAGDLDRLDREDAAILASRLTVLLLGAGHVGKAVARALAPLPIRVRWVDNRAEEFPAGVPEGVEVVVSAAVLAEIAAMPAGGAVLAMTHSHAIDFEIVAAALGRDDLAYVGVIGSATKRARFVSGLQALGMASGRIARLVCPIGGKQLRDKRPAVIAALVAAELISTLGSASVGLLEDEAA